jgi:hypothetical protein
VADVVSIDSGPEPTSTYLDDARAFYVSAPGHLSTRDAVAHLLRAGERELEEAPRGAAKAPRPEVFVGDAHGPRLVGHGNTGHFACGQGGQGGTPADKHVSMSNQAAWQPVFARLRGRLRGLFLIGCDVAATDSARSGAELLFALARTIDAPVSAPTGFTFYVTRGTHRGLWFEKDTRWLTATPHQKPPAVPPPSPRPPRLAAATIEGDPVEAVVLRLHPDLELDRAPTGVRSLEREVGADLVAEVDFSQPIEGSVGAFVTGELSATLTTGQERLFHIYNDRAISEVGSNRCYVCTSEFARRLAEYRSED